MPIGDAVGTYLEPLACVLRGAERVPRGRVLVVGQGFVGRLFAAVLRARGDDVYATDARAERAGRAPDGPVDAAVLCAPAAPLDAVAPGGTVLVFSPAAPVDLDLVYRNELTLTGSRSATPRHMQAALELLPDARPARADRAPARPLRGRARALPLRRRAQGRVHAVRALRFHGPGDLRLEDVPNPEPGPGDVLVQVEVALTDGTDLKTFRRGHPVLLRELPSPFGHEFCGIDVATGKRVVAANSAASDDRGGPIELLNGAYAELLRRAGGDRGGQPAARAARARRPRSRRWSSRSPAACGVSSERASQPGDRVAILGAGPIGLMLSACVADAGGRPEVVGGRAERRALVPEFAGATGDGEGADVVIEAAGTDEAWQRALELVRPGGTVLYFGGRESGAELRVDAYRLHYEELTLRGAFHHAPRHVRAALAFLASGAYPWQRLITHRVRLEDVAALLADPPQDYLKAAVVP